MDTKKTTSSRRAKLRSKPKRQMRSRDKTCINTSMNTLDIKKKYLQALQKSSTEYAYSILEHKGIYYVVKPYGGIKQTFDNIEDAIRYSDRTVINSRPYVLGNIKVFKGRACNKEDMIVWRNLGSYVVAESTENIQSRLKEILVSEDYQGASSALNSMRQKDKNIHVIFYSENEWAVRKTGALRALRVFPNKKDAIGYAKAISTEGKIDLVIHGKDGGVEKTIINDN